MSLLTLASSRSAWYGYDYYKAKNVVSFRQIDATEIQGLVKGSGDNQYEVLIDIERPRKSKCNCPHADGKRIICKHMIAVFFAAFPKEAEKYYADVVAYELEEEKRQEEMAHAVASYVGKLKKAELQKLLLEILLEGPEWQYERFVRNYIE
jgi:SWIM zinc finger.